MKNINLKIYQMKHDETTRDKKFFDIDECVKSVNLDDYYLMYEMKIVDTIDGDVYSMLDNIRFMFNGVIKFKGHSLSVSDIIELDGIAYYIQGFGFKKVDLNGFAEDRIALGFPR